MGRKEGKLKVEYIDNHKTRNITFKRRKECVMKKTKELNTLCDVNACMILYDPDHDTPTAPVSVWPPNKPAVVRQLTRQYMAKNSKNDDDDKISQFGVDLQKKVLLVRARIDQLKKGEITDDAEQRDQFGQTTMPTDVTMMDEADCVTSQKSFPRLLDLFH